MNVASVIKQHYILLALLVLGAVLRFYELDFQSVWLDEINTLNDANPDYSISEVFASVAKYDLHPPLYFFAIHFLFKLFGYTALVARAFSAVAGIAAIWAMYKLGRELFNKQVGLVTSALLCVNAYQIYYSQEARPYMVFCLFTILSFLYLARFVKLPTRRNAILYGVFTSLMLYGHLFGLFTLVGQIAVILFFIAVSEKSERKPFFVNAVIAGVTAFVLFIPSAKSFYAATLVNEFWIPKPTLQTFADIFSDFFGRSEIILLLTVTGIIFYLIRLSKEKRTGFTRESIVSNRMTFSSIILASWLVFTVVPPVVLSYVSTPMVIGRYFIAILPAIFIVVAIGIEFKNRLITVGVASIFLIVSLTDLAVSKYYSTVTKTQFRELTPLIAANNKSEPIATSLAWYFQYFLPGEKIVDANLDKYVGQMIDNPANAKSFWYVDAHDRPYHASAETEEFLKRHFVVTRQFEKYDIWAIHYSYKRQSTNENN